MSFSACPLCGQSMPFNPRYPRAVCGECARHACDSLGRPLDFYNEDMSGGFVAVYRDTGQPYLNHVCFIGGVRCRADEAYMGGIVVQIMEEFS